MTIDHLITKWHGRRGGAERANLPTFIHDLCAALDLPTPDPAEQGRLGPYQFDGPVERGSFRSAKATGFIDLYKRGHFILEAKQSQLPPERQSELPNLEPAQTAPRAPSGARYDQLMQGARAQAEHYARNLPGDHPPAPFIIVLDIGRAFEIEFDYTGNGRGYGFFPDKGSYRIELDQLRDPQIADRLRAIWTDPDRVNPRFQSAEVTRKIAERLAAVSQWLEATQRARTAGMAPHERSLAVEETALFLMRLLFCMFAEDIDLLPRDRFKAFLERSIDSDRHFERGLKDLWDKMGLPDLTDRFAFAVEDVVRYFNGGLFAANTTYVLGRAERGELLTASGYDWKKVEPAIFGTLLEQALSKEERAKLGAHYTPRPYVERLVQATIMDVLEAEWAAITDASPSSQPSPAFAGEERDLVCALPREPSRSGEGLLLSTAEEAEEEDPHPTLSREGGRGLEEENAPLQPSPASSQPSPASAGVQSQSRVDHAPGMICGVPGALRTRDWDCTERDLVRALPRGPSRSGEGLLPSSPPTPNPLETAHNFHHRLAHLRILDPACGTGNFLYVAMESIQQLESKVIERIQTLGGHATPRIAPHQFHGLELNPRAAKIAELVLWIGWLRFRIANEPEAIGDPVLGSTASINFGRPGGYDAVLSDDGQLPEWPEADFIIGNPPFIGGKDLRARLGGDYAEALWRANPRVPKSADFVMHWWDRAANILTQPETPLIRFGFVTTNSITQEFSRRVIAGYLSTPLPSGEGQAAQAARGEGGPSVTLPAGEGAPIPLPAGEAARVPLPWGEGGSRPRGGGRVRVTPETEDAPADHSSPSPSHSAAPSGPLPLPPGEGNNRLSLVYAIPDHPWTKATRDTAAVRIAMTVAERGDHQGALVEIVREAKLDTDAPELEETRATARIHADLSTGANPGAAKPLLANEGLASRGVSLHGAGFIVTPAEAAHLGLGTRGGLDRHIRPYRNGRDLMGRSRGAMVIDLFGLTEVEVRQRFPEVYEHLLGTVHTARVAQVAKSPTADAKAYLATWWLHGKPRSELRPALAGLSRYIATVETTKHRTFEFLNSDILPDNKIVTIATEDAFDLGVLSSSAHLQWTYANCGLLGVASFASGHVYVKSKTFDPFPFPLPTATRRASVAALAEELDATRKTALAETPALTMTELYNLRETLRSGTDLTPATRARATAARAAIITRIHDQLDMEVAASYGWEWPLPPPKP